MPEKLKDGEETVEHPAVWAKLITEAGVDFRLPAEENRDRLRNYVKLLSSDSSTKNKFYSGFNQQEIDEVDGIINNLEITGKTGVTDKLLDKENK